jgi:hypothetical protein
MEKYARSYHTLDDVHLVRAIARANASRQGAIPGRFGYVPGAEKYVRVDRISLEETLKSLNPDYSSRASDILKSEYRYAFIEDVKLADSWRFC